MIYHVVFTRYEMNGKEDFLRWEDTNDFHTMREAAKHGLNMVIEWYKDKEIISFEIVRVA